MPFPPTHMNPRMFNHLVANQRFPASMAQTSGAPRGPHLNGRPPGTSGLGLPFAESFHI